ncbi:MAG TPA: type II secretion system minor pseudopilin GspK [Steroidobacteraceae bacterium]|nr:type II secretion system minor pseudopilin GspK [Steroidobacteraceae bacterium]
MSTPRKSVGATRQRGVALITAILIVALATILATQIGFDSELEQRRSGAIFSLDQAFLVGLGAEAWAASYLKEDAENSKTDFPGERWATPIPPIPVDGGQVEGFVEDMQGRFNLNNLITPQGAVNPEGVRQFRNLLAELDLEPKWADILADWLDTDTQPQFPEGAEDSVYTSQTPPYRAANGPITSPSELLALPDFGVERYQKLRPYITALPVGTKINVCTAPGAVIDALSDGAREFSLDEQGLAKQRADHCFPTPQDLQNSFHGTGSETLTQYIDDKTSYFRVTALITIGTSQMTLYSLLRRDENTHLVRPVMRYFATE